MAISYQDKRDRYRSALPGDLTPGMPRFDNPTKKEVVNRIPALRGISPRDGFRVATVPPPPESPPVVETPHIEPIPFEADAQLDTPTIPNYAPEDGIDL